MENAEMNEERSRDGFNESSPLIALSTNTLLSDYNINVAIESAKMKQVRHISLGISAWGIFSSYLQYLMLCTSLWPYLSQIDLAVTPTFVGFVISGFGIGAAVSSPLMGLWSNRIKSIRVPIGVCLVISILGNLMYCFAGSFIGYEKYAVLVSRILCGVGNGATGIFLSYGADATFPHERDRMMSFQAGAISLGICVGSGNATNRREHNIVTTGPPVYSKRRRPLGEKLNIANEHFRNLELQGIVYRSGTPYAIPPHMAPKSDPSQLA